MAAQVTRVLLATLTVVMLLDILTNGNSAVNIANALARGWIGILQVLSGKSVTQS